MSSMKDEEISNGVTYRDISSSSRIGLSIERNDAFGDDKSMNFERRLKSSVFYAPVKMKRLSIAPLHILGPISQQIIPEEWRPERSCVA